MDAPKRPRLDDVKFCAGCGQTTHFKREREELPWTCMFCGAVEGKKKDNRDEQHDRHGNA